MNARPDIERAVTDWLTDAATGAGSERLLAATLAEAAASGQERYLTQRVFGDRLGRSRELRSALVVVLVAAATLSTALVAGALRPDPPVPVGPASNGWVAFGANGEAGDDLTGTDVGRGNGSGDIYLTREGGAARRIIGSEGDLLHQICPVFSPDGSKLAYVELEVQSVVSTPPPQPEGASTAEIATQAPDAAADGALRWAIGVVELAADGTVTAAVSHTEAQPTLSSCAEWSPDGQRLAYTARTAADQHELWVVTLDGRSTRVGPTVNPLGGPYGAVASRFDWSPDGSRIALVGDEQLWLIPADGQAPHALPGPGFQAVAWSPDGTLLAAGLGREIRVLRTDGTTISTIEVDALVENPAAFAWSPDGRWIAWADATGIVRATPDGSRQDRRPIDTAELLSGLLAEPLYPATPSVIGWSPDGELVLLAAGGLDTQGAILAVPAGSQAPVVVLVKPTFAIRGLIGASWQEVRG